MRAMRASVRTAVRPSLRSQIAMFVSLAILATGFDLVRPPTRQVSAHIAIASIETYQRWLSPHLPLVHCRFEETCSHFAVRSIKADGLVKGGWRAAQRLQQCM